MSVGSPPVRLDWIPVMERPLFLHPAKFFPPSFLCLGFAKTSATSLREVSLSRLLSCWFKVMISIAIEISLVSSSRDVVWILLVCAHSWGAVPQYPSPPLPDHREMVDFWETFFLNSVLFFFGIPRESLISASKATAFFSLPSAFFFPLHSWPQK